MKLNNKGFAITALLYSVMVLFLILFASTLKILKTRNDKLTKIADRVEDNVVLKCEDESGTSTTPYTSQYRGKYIFEVNSTEYYVYLPRYTTMKVESNTIKFYSNGSSTANDDIKIYDTNGNDVTSSLSSVTSFNITQICK